MDFDYLFGSFLQLPAVRSTAEANLKVGSDRELWRYIIAVDKFWLLALKAQAIFTIVIRTTTP
ncbi:MAG TPA: hypothetical protein VJT08_08855, partial [Terriglobales bacterium]|nr:hypothetical protein [Terriglobales bacterium]